MANATIGQCQARLKTDLEALLVAPVGPANVVYGYRTLPDKVSRAAMITYLGGRPKGQTTGGQTRGYRFAIVLTAQHDKTPTGLEAAENDLNAMENIVWDYLDESRNEFWLKVEFTEDSIRPPAPAELPSMRYGEIYFRLQLK